MKNWILRTAITAAVAISASSFAASPVSLTVNPASPGYAIPADFVGLSMEMKTLLPNAKGEYYFRGDNKPLIAMFKQLGIKNLRVGGNTTDTPGIEVPTGDKIDNLFAFTRAAGVNVIYTLRARVDAKIKDPADRAAAYTTLGRDDGKIAKYVMDHYKSDVLCFEIGNEPNVYAKTYPDYKTIFENFISVIKTPEFAPDAVFCGPNTTPGKADWPRRFATDFAGTGNVNLITQHAYFGGNSRTVSDQAAARAKMLSKAWPGQYQKMYDSFVPTVFEHKLPYRIEETNSFYNGGAKDVSDSHAAALWSLDYLYWWASHNAAGLNYHTGDKVAAGDESAPCWYASFWTSPTGYHALPVGYGIKAFDAGSHGHLLPLQITSPDNLNLTAYSVLGDDKNLYVTIINKENGENANAATITLNTPGFRNAETLPLTAPQNDIAALSGETLGGEPINDDGSWNGKWTPASGNTLDVPASSATVIRLTPQ